MEQIAFTMQIDPKFRDEYMKRHDAIWPELVERLRSAGLSDYSIFVDEATGRLFAVLRLTEDHGMDKLAEAKIVKKWWAHMADIMETNDDESPVVVSLERVFHMP